MTIAKALYQYIKEKHIPIAAICEETGLTPNQLYPSLKDKPTRVLKADELVLICMFLQVNPLQLSDKCKQAS